jgi:hypothetical protein
MLLETWSQVFTRAFQDISTGIIGYTPKLFVALVIFVLGWMFGAILGRVISQIVKTIKVDNFLREAGLEETFSKAGFNLDSGKFLGGLIKWFVVIIFLVASLEVLELSQVTDYLKGEVLPYLPNVIAAVLILLVSAVIAEVMQKIVTGSAKAAELPSARFAGTVTRWAIWIFAILAALGQLNVATAFVQTLFTGIVIAVSLAVGLAFGLGGQDAAARYIEHLRKDMPRHHEDKKDEKEEE